MKFFEPTYALKAVTPFDDKMGGRPQGLPPEHWPTCMACGGYQSFIAQFSHHPERLDLGRAGRVLYIFQCGHEPGMCETWEHSAGANSCIVLEPEDVLFPKGAGEIEMSQKKRGLPSLKNRNALRKIIKSLPPLENEVFVSEWTAGQDGVSALDYIRFFSDEAYHALPTQMTQNLTWATRLGGVPTWIQSANEYPKSGWRFMGQLGEIYNFYEGVKRPPKWVIADADKRDGRTHYGKGPNFGGGIAYLFLESRAKKVPNVKVFWQC